LFSSYYAEQLEYEEDLMREKMKEQRQENINFIGTLVRHDVAVEFAKILASAYEYGCPEAENIAKKFGFSQSDFFSINENYEKFKKEYNSWSFDYE
jgi:hypothetical protein